jgi:pimeloyl-ACP methyl ester carboxylesterase
MNPRWHANRFARPTVALFPALLIAAAAALGAQSPGRTSRVELVDVNGHVMRVQVTGLETRRPGEPVVVLEAGATNSFQVWSNVVTPIAEFAPVVAYDRAGLGESAWDDTTPTPQHVTNRLRLLLEKIGAPPPYILVGYSWGGMLAHYHAGYHPDDVAGLVFVDPGPVLTMSTADFVAPFEDIGAGRAGYDAYWSTFGGVFTRAAPPVRAEFEVFRGLMVREREERDLHPLPAVPVVVIVAGRFLPLPLALEMDQEAYFSAELRRRIGALQEWTLASPSGTLVVSSSTTHMVPHQDPGLIVWAVRRVLEASGERGSR